MTIKGICLCQLLISLLDPTPQYLVEPGEVTDQSCVWSAVQAAWYTKCLGKMWMEFRKWESNTTSLSRLVWSPPLHPCHATETQLQHVLINLWKRNSPYITHIGGLWCKYSKCMSFHCFWSLSISEFRGCQIADEFYEIPNCDSGPVYLWVIRDLPLTGFQRLSSNANGNLEK